MSLAADLRRLRRLEKKILAELIGTLQKEVAPHLSRHYCNLLCEFFPEQKRSREDERHPRERRFKSPDPEFKSLIGFTEDGIIHEVNVALVTIAYVDMSIDMLRALIPVSRRFARERLRLQVAHSVKKESTE